MTGWTFFTMLQRAEKLVWEHKQHKQSNECIARVQCWWQQCIGDGESDSGGGIDASIADAATATATATTPYTIIIINKLKYSSRVFTHQKPIYHQKYLLSFGNEFSLLYANITFTMITVILWGGSLAGVHNRFRCCCCYSTKLIVLTARRQCNWNGPFFFIIIITNGSRM